MRVWSCGLRVGPGAMYTNSVVTVLPKINAPAFRNVVTQLASGPAKVSGGNAEPHLVSNPLTQNTSFTPTSKPNNNGRLAGSGYAASSASVSRRSRSRRSPLRFGGRVEVHAVAHITGVLNHLDRFGGAPILITTDAIPLVRPDIEQLQIRPRAVFRHFPDLRSLAFNQTFYPNFYRGSDRAMFDAIGWDFVSCAAVGFDTDPRSQTVMTFLADTNEDDAETERARAAASLVQSRLMDVLREQLGATYAVTATWADRVPPRGHGTITVQFGSAPDTAERLSAAVLTEIRRLQTDGPSESDLLAVKATMSRALTTALSQNAYWMSALQRAALLGRDPAGIPGALDVVNGLTAVALREAVRRYLPLERHTVVTLLPASTATQN